MFQAPQRALAVLGFVLATSQALGGCGTTPTLPLPPPVASVGAPSLQGLVTVEGQANDDAFVTVFNTATEEGKIGRASHEGRFSIEIEAQAGDRLSVWQESDGIESERAELTVPATP